jgi:hypothetical protein
MNRTKTRIDTEVARKIATQKDGVHVQVAKPRRVSSLLSCVPAPTLQSLSGDGNIVVARGIAH